MGERKARYFVCLSLFQQLHKNDTQNLVIENVLNNYMQIVTMEEFSLNTNKKCTQLNISCINGYDVILYTRLICHPTLS